MPVGTPTELKGKWAAQGHRPKAPVKIGYEFIHLFVAIAPFWGKIFAMFLIRPAWPSSAKSAMRASPKRQYWLPIGPRPTKQP